MIAGISAITGFTTSYFNNQIQSRKNKLNLSKEKLLILVRLLEESINKSNKRIELIEKHIKILSDKTKEPHVINFVEETAIQQLRNRLNQDEYHTAFNFLFDDVIGSEQKFLTIRENANDLYENYKFIGNQFLHYGEEFLKGTENWELKLNQKRVDWAVNQLKEKPQNNLLYDEYIKILSTISSLPKPKNKMESLNHFYNNFYLPFVELIKKQKTNKSVETIAEFNFIEYEYKLILTKNYSMAKTAEAKLPFLKKATNELQNSLNELKGSLMKPLYKK